MPEEYKACGAQLRYPPETRGTPYTGPSVAAPRKADIDAWLKKIAVDAAEPKKKPASGALPANTEWL